MVYLVRDGDHNPELRYSLRSIAANLPHATVWIVGYKPTWVRSVQHIPTGQGRHKYLNALNNFRRAVRCPDVAENFVLMNDDFFAMHPGLVPQPEHAGTLRGLLKAARYTSGKPSRDYLWQLDQADLWLRSQGVDEPLSYDQLHTPMPIHRPTAQTIIDERLPLDESTYGYNQRSVYGNLAGIGGVEGRKTRPIRHGYWTWEWLSTNDRVFQQGPVGRFLEHRFPRPCQYEDRASAPWTKTRAWLNTDRPEHGGGRIRILRPGDPKGDALDASPHWMAV